jgi:poly(A)-specific ribonuclease
MMEVQRSRFHIELVKIIQEVADSHFIAFDLEFSGVADRRRPTDGGKLTLQQLYEDNKEAAGKYQVLQVGLTIVKEDEKKGV